MNSQKIISAQGICKSYKKGNQPVEILQNVDLDIDEKSFIALMGPSGSGKTTLLNLLGGLDLPDSGELSIQGQRIDKMSPDSLTKWRAQNVSYIFQFYNLLDVLTAVQNVELPLLLTSLSSKERRQRALTALDIVGLKDRSDHYPSQLSGGQEQRVAIARAIVTDPILILADEPTGDLDRKTADDILALLQALNTKHGKTILMVTHDLKAASYTSKTLQLEKKLIVDEA